MHMKIFRLITPFACFYLLAAVNGCSPGQKPGPAPETSSKANDEESVMSVLFQQQSAEYRALCLQAYHFAKLRVDHALAEKSIMPEAVITDLDETALDNGPEYAWMYRHNTTFDPKQWDEWCKMEKADSVPGSVSFFKYADSRKVMIYYVSNRDTAQLEATMENMKKLGFPQVEKSHFLLKETKESSKEGRRKAIAENHKIILLLGDNLSDFAAVYEHLPVQERKHAVDEAAALWGEKFVVFPNAIYGDWENALYEYKHGLNITQKDSLRISRLESY